MHALSFGGRPRKTDLSHGFTLVELLIVIAIIGVLVALIMPAIQAAREAGRRVGCANNLRQLAGACRQHDDKWNYFPSGGWGKWWAGNPDRQPGVKQPGGWHYNILPFLDKVDLHDIGAGGANMSAGGQRAQVVVSEFLCFSRHGNALALPFSGGPYININSPQPVIARSDYAGNGGSNFADPNSPTLSSPGANIGDPNGLYNPNFNWAAYPGTINSSSSPSTGVIFRASALSSAKIADGTSYTYLLGERYIPKGSYTQSPSGETPPVNDAGWDSGYDYNTIRWTTFPPSQDQNLPGTPESATIFGSAHEAGVNMAFCDGVVKLINYNIDPTLHMQLGHRSDGQPTQLQGLSGIN
jgi:prepilin-type N-terminal cleavage/methylation domain-containing protein